MSKTEETSGFGCVGAVLAAILSWNVNHAFWWMVLHFFLGWIYVGYRVFKYVGMLP